MTIDELENEALLALHRANHGDPSEAAWLRRHAAALILAAAVQSRAGGIILGDQPGLRAAPGLTKAA